VICTINIPAPFSGSRILIVEDEMMILLMMEEMLPDIGAAVTVAATVKQALASIDAKVFDAATLDLNLNGNESYPVADTLAARGVPFLFSTGYSQQNLKHGYRDRPVLRKPFKPRDLVDSLTRLLAC
jgi:CheY-like chemotaxis protein